MLWWWVVVALAAPQQARALTRIACLGDSITKGTGASRDELSWPSRVQKALGERQYEVLNFGKGGRTVLEEGTPYTDSEQWDDALDSGADVVTVGLGTNDAKSPEIWPTIPNVEDVFVAEYVDIIRRIREEVEPQSGDDLRVFLLIPVPQLSEGDAWEDASIINDRMPALIERVADEAGTGLINMRLGFEKVDDDDDPKYLANRDYYDDRIHPSDAGYAVMAENAMNGLSLTPVPTIDPTYEPTYAPTTPAPTTTLKPSSEPTTPRPSYLPTKRPTSAPTAPPTYRPTTPPTPGPSYLPSPQPSPQPTTPEPTSEPTSRPTPNPSPRPSLHPTPKPTATPSPKPTASPTTYRPSPSPSTSAPTGEHRPSPEPTRSLRPTLRPTTYQPSTAAPTESRYVVSLSAALVLSSDIADFNSDSSNAAAFEDAVESAVLGVDDCRDAVARSRRRRRQKRRRLLQQQQQPETTTTVDFDADLVVKAATLSDAAALGRDSFAADLITALDDGSLDAALQASARTAGATALLNGAFDATESADELGGIVVGGVVLLAADVPSPAPSSITRGGSGKSSGGSSSAADQSALLATILATICVVGLFGSLFVYWVYRRQQTKSGAIGLEMAHTEVDRKLRKRSLRRKRRRHRPDAVPEAPPPSPPEEERDDDGTARAQADDDVVAAKDDLVAAESPVPPSRPRRTRRAYDARNRRENDNLPARDDAPPSRDDVNSADLNEAARQIIADGNHDTTQSISQRTQVLFLD